MKVLRRTILSEILEVDSEDELSRMIGLLSFERDGKVHCLVTDTGKFFTGLIPFLESKGLTFEMEDLEPTPKLPIREAKLIVEPEILNTRTLRDYQIMGAVKTLAEGRGILEVGTGGGKTEMAAAAIEHYRCLGDVRTVVCLVPTVYLMQQMADRFEQFGLGNVGRSGGGDHHNGEDIVVYVVNSAFNALNDEDGEFIRNADMLILDEAHHAKAATWRKVCEVCKARIRLAYTATAYEDPEKFSYEDLILLGLIGPVFYEVRSIELRRRGYLADPLVTFITPKTGRIPVWSWSKVYKLGIVGNKARNSIIASLALSLYEGYRKVMIFVGQKKHGHHLAKMLQSVGCESVFVHGGSTSYIYKATSTRKMHWTIKDIGSYVNDSDRCVLITTQVLDEGVDAPVIDSLIMATGMKKYRRTIQRIGRGMRPKKGQNKVFVFDFWDTNHNFLLKQSKYRMWTYQEEEYDFADSLQHASEVVGCKLVADDRFLRDV